MSKLTANQSQAAHSTGQLLEARLGNVQAIAGGLFFVFLLLHLSNNLLAGLGVETYNSYQRAVRAIYQQPVLELLLVVVPLISHAVAGVWLYRLRKKWQLKRGLKYQLQTWAGFFLLLTVFGHALATRGVSFFFGPFAEFAGVSFSLWWVPAYFYPYYFLLFMAGLYHGTMGAAMLLQRLGVWRSHPSSRIHAVVLGVGAIGVSLSLVAFGGKLFAIDDPPDNDYARQYAEFFDIDLGQNAALKAPVHDAEERQGE